MVAAARWKHPRIGWAVVLLIALLALARKSIILDLGGH